MKKKANSISIRWKLFLVVLLVQIPFCGLFFYYSNRTVNQVNNQLAESQLSTLNVFRESLETQIKNAEDFLYTICWGSDIFTEISEAATIDEVQISMEQLLDDALLLTGNNANLNTVTLYCPNVDAGWVVNRDGIIENSRYLPLLQQLITEGQIINRGWQLRETDSGNDFVRVCEYKDVYAMVAMNLNEIATNARVYSSLSASIVVRKGSRILNNAVWIRGFGDQFPEPESKGENWYMVENPLKHVRYQIVETNFAGMTLCMGTRYLYDWTWMRVQSIGLGTVFLITLLVGIAYLHRTFFRPMNNLVNVMDAIGRGERPSLELPNNSREFTKVSDTFRDMLTTLEEQKIAVYEKEIKAQKMETNALRLQIRRHFFLNCLKNIYSLANGGDIDSIKKIVLLMSVNLRYTLEMHKDAVELAQELRECETYVELQGVGQARPPVLRTQIAPELLSFQVPPVSILTMLENCCKYGSRQDEGLVITITAQLREMDTQKFVCIAIQDNGLGFRGEDLMKLNNNLSQVQEEGHVGISNTMARIRMMYGERCEVLFSNRAGARVEWIIPLSEREENT